MKLESNLSKELRDIIFTGQPSPKKEDIASVFSRLFQSDDGKRALAHLQAITYERSLGPDASNEALRYLEGQRSMIGLIFRLIDQGRS